jgi:HSP20 family molecular chaperone IbpA
MVRRFHRSIYDELDELRASMDYLYQLALEPADNPLLPAGETPGLVCRCVHNLNAEVAGNDNEVTVTVDIAAGTGTSGISVDLIHDMLLKITCQQGVECADTMGNPTHEQHSFSLHHLVPLPEPVMGYGARVSLVHGVLDIHLKKAHPARA